MYKLVLIRHGQTVFNKEKIFTGWTESELTEQGLSEAHQAGVLLKRDGFHFDLAFTSVLHRAIETLEIVLAEMGESGIPVHQSWRLNERHYGALQGIRHEEMAAKYGADQVQIWRRSYAVRPPQLSLDDPRYPGKNPLYKDLTAEQLPRGESLEDTVTRVMPYWHDEIVPQIKAGKSVIVSASGNSLRGLIKHLDSISDTDIVSLEITTGAPLIYELEEGTLKPIRHYYLK
jgi:2,3-bisphosphoglycerate-dependent phosphoglycerate mutase